MGVRNVTDRQMTATQLTAATQHSSQGCYSDICDPLKVTCTRSADINILVTRPRITVTGVVS